MGSAIGQRGEMMDELISRPAAISAICNACGKIDCDKMDKCEKLQLPPANCSEFPNNSDTISRRQAIDALCNDYCGGHQDCKYYPNCENLRSVQKLPSAQPAEPKRGKWILDRSGAYCCSKCMEPCAGYVMMKPRDKFCKMCGSRNEVTE